MKLYATKAYVQNERLSFLDRFGVYLSIRRIRKEIRRMNKNNKERGGICWI